MSTQTSVADALRDKAMAKEYLLAADKYVKAGQFEKAREQIEKARAADPSNPYIPAFEDRIKHFEVQQAKEKPVAAPPPKFAPAAIAVPPEEFMLPPPPPAPPPTVRTLRPGETPISITLTDPALKAVIEMPQVSTSAPQKSAPVVIPGPPPPKAESLIPKPPAPEPVSPRTASRDSDAVRRTQSVTAPISAPAAPPIPTPPRGSVDPVLNDQIAEMRRQLQELTSALQHERKAREEVQRQQLESIVRQFRSALEKAWQFGAPKAKDAEDLRRLAATLTIPPDVESSVTREVKLAMYGRAVKEVIAKRKMLKSSSSTLEWLRKVYQISLNEYLEYESQFLMDLVSDQFRGTMLFVAAEEKLRSDLIPRFKSFGFAVVIAPTPEVALEKVDKLSPNVIICDSSFGEGSLSGVKFLHIIRSNPKFGFIPFLLLCDTTDGAQIPTTDLRPNEAVVTKPIDFDELNGAMNDKLNQLRHYISTL